MAKQKRALVTLPEGVWEIIDRDLKGKLGDGDSEVIRNIVVSYLAEKGYFQAATLRSNANIVDQQEISDLSREFRRLDDFLMAALLILEKKKIASGTMMQAELKKIQSERERSLQ